MDLADDIAPCNFAQTQVKLQEVDLDHADPPFNKMKVDSTAGCK